MVVHKNMYFMFQEFWHLLLVQPVPGMQMVFRYKYRYLYIHLNLGVIYKLLNGNFYDSNKIIDCAFQ